MLETLHSLWQIVSQNNLVSGLILLVIAIGIEERLRRRRPKSAAVEVKPQAAPLPPTSPSHRGNTRGQFSNSWNPWTLARSAIVKPVKGSRIHPGMVAILESAGQFGAHWSDFNRPELPWIAEFRQELVDKAMGELSRKYGFPIEYIGLRGEGHYPDRYRISQGWNHTGRVGSPTSPTDFNVQ